MQCDVGEVVTGSQSLKSLQSFQSSKTSQRLQGPLDSEDSRDSDVSATMQSQRLPSERLYPRQDSVKRLGEGPKFLIRSAAGVAGLFVGLVPGAYACVATTGD